MSRSGRRAGKVEQPTCLRSNPVRRLGWDDEWHAGGVSEWKIEESADHRVADRVLLGSSTGIGGMGVRDLERFCWRGEVGVQDDHDVGPWVPRGQGRKGQEARSSHVVEVCRFIRHSAIPPAVINHPSNYFQAHKRGRNPTHLHTYASLAKAWVQEKHSKQLVCDGDGDVRCDCDEVNSQVGWVANPCRKMSRE